MSKKNLVVFAGSQEIENEEAREELHNQFKIFLETNKDKIAKILFWWQDHGVMWLVNDLANELWIDIKGYSIEKYRKYDEWNGIDVDFFEDDYSRIKEFTKQWDIFIALPGWEWTIREIGYVADNIWLDEWKYVFISNLFEEYLVMLNSFKRKNMSSPHDLKIKKIVDISTVRI